MYEGFGYGGEKEAIVLDIGNAYTKIGFANDCSPRSIIPTEVFDKKSKTKLRIADIRNEETMKSCLLSFLKTIYLRHLQVNAKDRRAVIVENMIGPIDFRKVVADVLFKHFEVPSLLFAPSHLISLMPLGISTGLVLDCGYKETIVIPVCDNTPVLKAWQALPIGGKAVHNRIKEMIKELAVIREGDKEIPASELPSDIITEEILEDIKVRCCFVTRFDRANTPDIEHPPETIYPLQGSRLLIVPGKIREMASEVLFEMDGEEKNIATLILDSLILSSIDNRRNLLENIVLIGGTSQMIGFRQRLLAELKHLVSTNNKYSESIHLSSFKFHKAPIYENCTAWLGGAMFAGLQVLPNRSTSREKYLENETLMDWSDPKTYEN